jgi:hypothetical protein
LSLNLLGSQFFLDKPVTSQRCRLVDTIPEHAPGVGFRCQRQESFGRWSSADQQARSPRAQRLVEALQGLMEPPSRCRSRLLCVFIRRPNEDRHDREAVSRCRAQGRMIGQAEIPLEPDENALFARITHLRSDASERNAYLLTGDSIEFDLAVLEKGNQNYAARDVS